jgi:hypothetical protein
LPKAHIVPKQIEGPGDLENGSRGPLPWRQYKLLDVFHQGHLGAGHVPTEKALKVHYVLRGKVPNLLCGRLEVHRLVRLDTLVHAPDFGLDGSQTGEQSRGVPRGFNRVGKLSCLALKLSALAL